MTLDMVTACIAEQRRNGTLHDRLIGIVVKEFRGIGPAYKVDDYVLFRRYPLLSNVGEVTGYHLTVERPMSIEQIEAQRLKNSLLTTVGTIVGVPAHYVREIEP